MTVIRVKHQKEFTILSNSILQDSSLSLEAIGLWSHCMSRPEDWTFYISQLAEQFKISTKKVYRVINELIARGFAFKGQKREIREGAKWGKKRVFAAVEYIFFAQKISEQELKSLESQYCITNFQKILPLAQNEHAQNYPLQSTDSLPSTDSSPPYPQNGGNPPISPEGGNETALKPKRKRREREPMKEKAERVWLTDAQEESIKKKVDGDEIILRFCYEKLSQSKIKRKKTGGSDYMSILNWVINAVYEDIENEKIKKKSSNVPYSSNLEGVHKENWEKNFNLIEKLKEQFPHKTQGLYFFYKNYLLKDKNRGKDGEIFDVSALINHRSFCGVVGKHLDIEITIDPEEKY